jgi:general secretion pathway protein E
MTTSMATVGATFSDAELDEARRCAPLRGIAVVAALEELGGLDAAAFTHRLAATFRCAAVAIQDLHRWSPAFDLLPFTDAVRRQVLLMRGDAGELLLMVGDPFSVDRLAWAEERIAHPFTWALAHHADLTAFLSRHEEGLSAVDTLLVSPSSQASRDTGLEDLSIKSITEDSSPVVRFVRSSLYDALKTHASDVHMETNPGGLEVKYRIDGVLVAMHTLSGPDLAEQVVSRIKVMSSLDIAERRIPQDGRFTVSVRGREIDFRVSVMPSIHGEDVVMRILDKQRLADEAKGLTLDTLGFAAADRILIRRLSLEPHGMLLVTGPTGSGKTTTLYAAICETNDGTGKTVTIEDPVEYQLPGVLQIPVHERKGLTFARGLRSILRHDPDRIMVGEIRDGETAQIAVQAALTGHLVFTTVHANNVFDVLGRFIHMDVDPYGFAAALNGIVAQRLVRLNCVHCSASEVPSAERLAAAGIAPTEAPAFDFRLGRGCGQCRSTGYLGRTAIAEIMVLTDELREMIVSRQPIRLMKETARRGGTRLLREAALQLVREGRTSLMEVDRVVSPLA